MNFDKRYLNKKLIYKNIKGKIVATVVVTALFAFTGAVTLKANVGIGTTTPSSMLTVVGTTTDNAFFLTGNFNQIGVAGASGTNGLIGSNNVFVAGSGGTGTNLGGGGGGMCFLLGTPANSTGDCATTICGGSRSGYSIIGAGGAGSINTNTTTGGCAFASSGSCFSLFDVGFCGGNSCTCCGVAIGGAGPDITFMGGTSVHCGGTARATTGGKSCGGNGGNFGVGNIVAPFGGNACGTACNVGGRGFAFAFGTGYGGCAIGGTTNCAGSSGSYIFHIRCGGNAIGTGAGNLVNCGGSQGTFILGTTGSPGILSLNSGGMACGIGACMFGGCGSCIQIMAGNGGCAVGGSVSNTGGVGGDIHLIAGMGGTGATANGRNGNIVFWSCNTEIARFDNTATCVGRFGIGTAAPAGLLHVSSDTAATGQTFLTQANASADSFDLNFRKARGTGASPTVITTADELGVINFTGYGGAAGYITGAAIKGISSGTIANSRVPGQLSFWTGTNAAPSVLTERMTIDNAGNVGIGITAPTSPLHIVKTLAGVTGVSTAQQTTQTITGDWSGAKNNTGLGITQTMSGINTSSFMVNINNGISISTTDSTTINGGTALETLNGIKSDVIYAGTNTNNLNLNHYGGWFSSTGDMGTNGSANKYGLYARTSGTADTNYGVYTTASGATLNYGLYSAAGTNYFANNVGIGTVTPTSPLQVVGLPIYANNAAAVAGGLTAGAFYRTGGDPDLVSVVH